MTLGLDDGELVACVSCGLCLPHCPTYRVTGFEVASPRGRIAAMRAVEHRGAPVDAAFVRAMEECVLCRGCEEACPSGVPFGHLMEQTRASLPPPRSRWRRIGEWAGYRLVLPRHRVLLALTWLLLAAQRLRMVPRRFGLPRLTRRSLRRHELPRGGRPDAWLFTGCVMDAWMRDTHRSTARVMESAGARAARPATGGSCCGALHEHAGRVDDARRLAARTIASMPGTAPVVVNSAGCGAAMKGYGRLLGTADAAAFSARVRDFGEWLVEHGMPPVRHTGTTVVVQDPCHLRHVQHGHGPVRAALAAAYVVRETDDDGLCCGAGGAYSLLHPGLANEIRARKVDALLAAANGDRLIVASANPGCAMHLQAAGLDVRHPADLLATALMTGSSRPPEDTRGE